MFEWAEKKLETTANHDITLLIIKPAFCQDTLQNVHKKLVNTSFKQLALILHVSKKGTIKFPHFCMEILTCFAK